MINFFSKFYLWELEGRQSLIRLIWKKENTKSEKQLNYEIETLENGSKENGRSIIKSNQGLNGLLVGTFFNNYFCSLENRNYISKYMIVI